MKKRYYQHLLQFLVALAVGTLCGDALLHLLPHAINDPDDHNNLDHEHSNETMWKGFVTMIGIIFFFIMEKSLTFCTEWRNRSKRKTNQISRVKVMHEGDNVNIVGEKLCKHKYSSFPYCYDDIAVKRIENNCEEKCRTVGNTENNLHESSMPKNDTSVNSTTLLKNDFHSVDSVPTILSKDKNHTDLSSDNFENIDGKIENGLEPNRETYTVIIREHENKHHGHSHTHVHVHSAPENLSSVVWMVIMGDGLHNFTDGVAIGAAFSNSLTGGFSTTLAVFCHELPHELGDFAVLLKAGMSAKQAIYYNLLTSVLCFLGMVIGIVLGNNDQASSWTFALTAGIFLYIALVDLIPELTSSHLTEVGSVLKCILQLTGLVTGLVIMTMIAMYEHQLIHIFNK